MDKKICPMLTMYATTFKTPKEYQDRDCLEEKCAWWYEVSLITEPNYRGHCAIQDMALAIRVIADSESDTSSSVRSITDSM